MKSDPDARSAPRFDCCEPRIASLIRKKAKALCRCHGFRRDEAEDIAQDLHMHLLLKCNTFDPTRATPIGYAAVLIERKVVSIVRHRFAQRRDPGREDRSLDATVTCGEGRVVARHETIAGRATDFETIDRRTDVAAIIDALPRSAQAEARGLLRQCTNGGRSRACEPSGSAHDVLWREFSTLVDAPPARR